MIGVVNQYHTGYFELPKQMSACSVHSKTMARHVTSPTLLRAGRRIDAITHVEGEAMGQKLVGHKIDPPRGTEEGIDTHHVGRRKWELKAMGHRESGTAAAAASSVSSVLSLSIYSSALA